MLQDEIDDYFKKTFGYKRKKKRMPAAVLEAYDIFKRKYNRIDFDDILLDFVTFLNDPASEPERTGLKHLMVDEYQDINKVQELIIRAWIQNGAVLTAVGDEGQSIYGFRGSEIKYILDFDFKNHKKFVLFKNYRNPPSVVKIAKAVLPTPKQMEAQRHKGKVFIREFPTLEVEATNIAKAIAERPKSVAVLVRYHRQTPLIEIALRKLGIPYQISKSSSIFDAPILRCFLSFCRVYLDTSSAPDWQTIFSFLPLVGKKTAQKWKNCAFGKKLTKADQKCQNAYLWVNSLPQEDVGFSLELIFQKLHAVLHAKMYATKSDNVREEIQKQMQKLKLFQENISIDDASNLVDFLSQGALYNDNLERAQVEILTIHQSKGLEYERVFVPNVSNGEFPNSRAEDLDEEKRLFYVAVTRTIQELHLSYVSVPSDFLMRSLKRLQKARKNKRA
jgi:DNA helicase-2/ATP-dependent DNA helicase PcrA